MMKAEKRVIDAAMRWWKYLQEWEASSYYSDYMDQQLDAKQARLEKAIAALAAQRKGAKR